MARFWNALYAAHADVVLSGHDHMYERFAQQGPEQKATSAGIREFVVGTGGESLLPIGSVLGNSQFRDNKHFGVLFLTLHGGSYEWAFRTTEGASVLDSGSSSCHAQSSSSASLGPVGGVALRRARASAIGSGSASDGRGASGSAARGAAGQTPLRAVLHTQRLARFAFGEKPLVFGVRALRQPSATDGSLPLEIHCSRGCDVDITLRVRHTTVARYRETENEIRKSYVRLSLQLSPEVLRRIGRAPATATFVATDSASETRSVTQAVTVVGR